MPTEVVSLWSVVKPSVVSGVGRRVIGDDGTAWVRVRIPRSGPNDQAIARRKRALNAKITYVCEAASRMSGLSAAHHAGVPEATFRAWRKDRNFFYWPPDDTAKAIEARMALDGYRLERPRDESLLRAIVDAAELGYRLYQLAALAHGIPHPA